ncbi:MAG: holo-ACP synthase [Leptospiraceae bacterium]|nr:holo-ACP synthase [Leptospiraceae bacterium]
MICGLGTDIVENQRIAAVYQKHGERFLRRIFTAEEIEYALSHINPVPYLAARFAVKEAAVKAMNVKTGMAIGWKDIEVSGKIFGKKDLIFHGAALKRVQELGVARQHLSLSHNDDFSMAVVILEALDTTPDP